MSQREQCIKNLPEQSVNAEYARQQTSRASKQCLCSSWMDIGTCSHRDLGGFWLCKRTCRFRTLLSLVCTMSQHSCIWYTYQHIKNKITLHMQCVFQQQCKSGSQGLIRANMWFISSIGSFKKGLVQATMLFISSIIVIIGGKARFKQSHHSFQA